MTVFQLSRQLIFAGAMLAASACAAVPAFPAPPAAEAASPEERAALDIVARRIAAYNAHDIEAFLATYDEKVRIYIFPERFLGEGRERMRRIFGPQFAKGDGTVKVVGQYVLENKVVSDEIVTISGAVEHNIAVYTISGGLISEVRLIEPGE
jgi:hypothetical protein